MTDRVAKHGMPELVVSGGAKGADTLGEQWARKHKIKVLILKPDWKSMATELASYVITTL